MKDRGDEQRDKRQVKEISRAEVKMTLDRIKNEKGVDLDEIQVFFLKRYG